MTLQPLILAIGSTNQPKVQALQNILKEYPFLATANVVPVAVESGISDQPLSLEETIMGAKNRAASSFQACEGCDLSFGIESGLMRAPGSQTGFLHICVCSVYSGETHHIGMSTGFEVPPSILKLVLERNMNLSEACYHAGITESTTIGQKEGLVGILTKGRVSRQQYSQQCIITALVQLENSRWFNEENSTRSA